MKTGENLYNSIGKGYNSTRQADPYLTERLFRLLAPQSGKTYLDIGCGTGNYTLALAEKGIDFWGVEPSEIMLAEAKTKSNAVNWQLGSAENIPADNHTFDGAIATLTLHHWKNLFQAFSELYRVLKPDAGLVIFTATPEQMEGYWLNHYFPKMLDDSIRQMPFFETIEQFAFETGLKIKKTEKYFIQPDLKDLFLYSGKHRPELYFNLPVRKGISSFVALANAEEVKKGLADLLSDIREGKFAEISKSYENDLGDYLFLVFTS